MRTGTAFILLGILGATGVFYAEVMAWIGADIILIFSYFAVVRKLEAIMKKSQAQKWSCCINIQ